jgi:pentatricopeptide repeat protein
MCLHHGYIWKVLPTLKSYEKELLLIKNCDVYNIILKGAARNGDWLMVQEIRTLMEELQVSPDIETYAACFACLGACTSEISTVWAEKLVQEMEYGIIRYI